ncbi:MAG TPA: hypothetical protein VG894_04465 [Bauldia sp.]|nr:hypothetical protein [Bauldia sp.]
MKRIVLGTIAAAVATAGLLAAAPASAASALCTADDAGSATFTARAFGIFPTIVAERASDRAMFACESNTTFGGSCAVVHCTFGPW